MRDCGSDSNSESAVTPVAVASVQNTPLPPKTSNTAAQSESSQEPSSDKIPDAKPLEVIIEAPKDGTKTRLPPPPPPLPPRKLVPAMPSSSLDELGKVIRETGEEVGTSESIEPNPNVLEEEEDFEMISGDSKQDVATKAPSIDTREESKDKQHDQVKEIVVSRPIDQPTNPTSRETTSQERPVQQQPQATNDKNPFQRIKAKPELPSHRIIPPPPLQQGSGITISESDHQKTQQTQERKTKVETSKAFPKAQSASGIPGARPPPPRDLRMYNMMQASHQRPTQTQQQRPADRNKHNPASYSTIAQQQYQHTATSRPGTPGRAVQPPPGYYQARAQQAGHPARAQVFQQQQHRAGQRPPQATRRTAPIVPPLQGLWSRVEKSLDDLANLEDAITGRASTLVNTAVPRKWRRDAAVANHNNNNNNKRQQRQSQRPGGPKKKLGLTSQPLSTPHTRWQHQQKLQLAAATNKAKASGSSSQPSFSVHPYSLLDKTNRKFASTPRSNLAISSVKRVEWDGLLSGNARKLMPANGGASAPNGYQQSWQSYSGQDNQGQSPASNSPPQQAQESRVIDPNNQQQQGADKTAAQRQQQQQASLQQYGPRSPVPPQGQVQRQDAWQQQNKLGGAQAPPPTVAGNARSAFSEQERKASVARPTQVSRSSSFDDDDDDKKSFLSRTIGAIPIPSVGKLLNFRRKKVYNNYASLDAWDAAEDDSKSSRGFFGIFRGKKGDAGRSPAGAVGKKQENRGTLPQPVHHLLERSDKGTTASLLSVADKKRIRGIGKSRAIMDAIALSFFIWGVRELKGLDTVPVPTTLHEFGANTVPNLLICILTSGDTWAPITLLAAFLTVWTNSLIFDGRVKEVATDVAKSVEAEASYGRLFLRLVASTPTDISLPTKLFRAAGLQVSALADLSRLRSYVTYAITAILIMTVDFIRPLVLSIVGSVIRLAALSEWRTWPIAFDKLLGEVKAIFSVVGNEIRALIGGELVGAGHHPMQVAFKASILAALFGAACLPALEKRRKFTANEDNEEENTEEISRRMSEQISDLGASSASRLGILSKNGGIESTIERWRLIQEESSNQASETSIGSLFRRLGYYIASWFILAAPVLIFGFLLDVPMSGWTSATVSHWEAMFEVSLLLLTTNGLAWKAAGRAVESSHLFPEVQGFLKSLARASEESSPQKTAPQALRTGANPTAGLLVKNFWAAHVVKRAWAVRGANLQCRNGEVVVLLGDDGAGKTRLLTAVAESIISPPKQALTTQIQRGNVSVGGIDVAKWDRNELKKRVSLSLSDIRALAKTADLWSGLSLEEILEPGDPQRITDPTHVSGAREKSCMLQALKISGLYWSLLPRLPSKLSTILTSSEEDLAPSPMRPRYFVLSPSEWNKLMLAKLLAQAIYDSENSVGTTGKIENCLVGSLFLLDDSTMMLSETEESKLLRDLRQTGVATVLSSNKWATGRLADRIAVVKDGAIVETGTHNELLSRGPQHSYYAAKWQAMTSA